MKALIFADLHAHNFRKFAVNRDGINSRLSDILACLVYIRKYAKDHKIPVTLFAGDLFHTFSFVENDVMNLVSDILKSWPGEFVYVSGNHDVKSKISYEEHAVASAVIAKLAPNLAYLNGDLHKTKSGLTVYGLSWRNDHDFLNEKFKPADIFLGHQLVENPFIPSGLAIPEEVRALYKLMVFGDLHISTWNAKKKLLVPGTPLQHSFKDEGLDKGFWLLDDDFVPRFIETEFPRFVTVKSVKEVKEDKNFYRIISPSDKPISGLPANAIVQQKVNSDFRESTLSMDLDDRNLLAQYIKTMKVEEGKFAQVGLDILSKCAPANYTPRKTMVTSIHVANFGSYVGGHNFQVKDGMHLVLGNNGNGKTTLFEALYWCLFGEATKDILQDEVVNDIAGKNCEVCVEIDCGEERIRITRHRLHSEYNNEFWFTVYKGSEESHQVKRENTKETQRLLEGYLGTNKFLFKIINYFSQEKFEFFSSLTDAGQKDVCKALLPISRFEEAEELANNNLKVVSQDLTSIQYAYSTTKNDIVNVGNEIATYEKLFAEWEDYRREEGAILNDEVLVCEKKLRVKVGVKEAAYAEYNTAQEESTPRIAAIQQDKAIRVAFVEKEIAEALAGAVETGELPVLRKQMEEVNRALQKNRGEWAANGVRMKSTKGRLAEATADLHKSHQDTKCPTCKQEMPQAVVEGVRKTLDNIIARFNEDFLFETKEDTRLTFEFDKLAVDAKNLTERIVFLQNEQSIQQQGLSGRVTLLNGRIKEITEEAAKKAAEFSVKTNNLYAVWQSLNTECTHLTTALEQARRLLADKIAEKNPHAVVLENKTSALKELNVKLAGIEQKVKTLEDAQEVYSFWRTGFSNQGIVSYILDDFSKQFTNELNKVLLNISAGHFYGLLSTQKKLKSGEYREKFELKIYIDNKCRSYGALSGGQKARIDIATVLVLNTLVKKFYALEYWPMGILILDELLTYLDPEGIECVLDELEAAIKNGTIYLITNKKDVAALISSTIQVEYSKEQGTKLVLDGYCDNL